MNPDTFEIEVIEPVVSSQTRNVVIVVAATIAVAAAGTYLVRKFKKNRETETLDTEEYGTTQPAPKTPVSN